MQSNFIIPTDYTCDFPCAIRGVAVVCREWQGRRHSVEGGGGGGCVKNHIANEQSSQASPCICALHVA